MVDDFGLHAAAGVGNRQRDEILRRIIRCRTRVIMINCGIVRCDDEPASTRHRIACVDGEIKDYLFQLRSVVSNRPGIHIEVGFDQNVIAHQAVQQLHRITDNRIQVENLRFDDFLAAVVQQLGSQTCRLLC